MGIDVYGNGQKVMTTEGEGPHVIVPEHGIRVSVPEAVEITPEATIKTMREMSQRAWEHISTGPPFQELYQKLFAPEDWGKDMKPPATIEELNNLDKGIIHACGMIVMGFENMVIHRRHVYFEFPETYLHPKVVRRLMDMLCTLKAWSGVGVTTTIAEAPVEDRPAAELAADAEQAQPKPKNDPGIEST